jgi:hypothetical protein
VTLPLWRTVLPAGPVAVLVYRDPMEVARSLQERDGFPLTLGLALWHRYVRQSLVSVDRLPVLVVDYARSLEEPRATVDDLTMFLIAHGITPGADRSELAAQVLSRDLQHHREGRPDETLEKDLQPLFDVLRDRLGAHAAWSVPELPPEPGWVEDVIRLTWAGLAVTAAMQNAQHELKWVKKSRLFRATHALWRVTRTGPVLSPVEEGAPTADPGSNGAASAPAVSA